MKVGDMVRSIPHGILINSSRVGIIVDIIQKKCWRTDELGPHIDWRKVDPESHAVVLFSENNGTISVPFTDLEKIS